MCLLQVFKRFVKDPVFVIVEVNSPDDVDIPTKVGPRSLTLFPFSSRQATPFSAKTTTATRWTLLARAP